jgi:MFS family permease
MLIVGRFIAGISIGVLSMIVPVYQAEISPPVSCCLSPKTNNANEQHARGLLSGWTQLMIVWGYVHSISHQALS